MSMRMGYECECESENVYEFEPNTRTAPCRGCQVHSFVSRSSLLPQGTHRMANTLREDTAMHANRRGIGLTNVLIRYLDTVISGIQTVDRPLTGMLSL